MNHEDVLNALCLSLAGKPASACDWHELLKVRDTVDSLLNAAVNDKQAGDVAAPIGGRRDRTGEPIDADAPAAPDPRTAARQHLHHTLGWAK